MKECVRSFRREKRKEKRVCVNKGLLKKKATEDGSEWNILLSFDEKADGDQKGTRRKEVRIKRNAWDSFLSNSSFRARFTDRKRKVKSTANSQKLTFASPLSSFSL